jgi:hypothetical protein
VTPKEYKTVIAFSFLLTIQWQFGTCVSVRCRVAGSRTPSPEGTSISGMSVIIAMGREGTVTDMRLSAL